MRRTKRAPEHLLFLAVIAAACARAPLRSAPERPAPEPVILSDAEVSAIAEVLYFEDRREFDSTRLAALSEFASAEVRRRAALALGRIGDRRATALLLQALDDPDPSVWADAAFALGELGDTAADVARALARRTLVGQDTPAVYIAAAVEATHALGKLGTAEAGDLLIGGPLISRMCVDPVEEKGSCGRRPDDVVGEALLALWKFPRRGHLFGFIAPLAKSPNPEIRWRATYALMRLGYPQANQLVGQDLLQDKEPLVRAVAARALRASVADSAGERAATTAALTRALHDPDPHVRINAARTLGPYRDSTTAPALIALLSSEDANVAIAAADALGDVGGGVAAAELDRVIASDARLALRGAALASLQRAAPTLGTDRARTWAGADAWLTRFYAARALGRGRWSDAAPVLRELLQDADPRTAAAAMESMVALAADTGAAARALYIEGLASSDPMVRAAALSGLARQPEPGDLPALLAAYDRAQRDTILNDAALAALDALGALAERGVPAARSFYLRFPRPPDALIRLRARARLGAGSWGDPLPVETGWGRDHYERVVRELVVPELEGQRAPRVRIRTAGGEIVVALAGAAAPLTVYNLLELARRGFFDGGRWHRVVPNFVLQDGDPRGDGNGGPGYAIRDEMTRIRYLRGTLGMALSGPDTGGSQFFLTHSPQPHLDGGYTAFGRVVAGLEVADRVVQDDLIDAVEVIP